MAAGLFRAPSPRTRAEILRFVRISVLAFAGQLVAVESAGGRLPLGWSGLGALAAAAVESAIHQFTLSSSGGPTEPSQPVVPASPAPPR